MIDQSLEDGMDWVRAPGARWNEVQDGVEPAEAAVGAIVTRWALPRVERKVRQVSPGQGDGFDVVGHHVLNHAGRLDRHLGPAEHLFGHILARGRLHQGRSGGEDGGRFGHDGEVRQRRRQCAVPGGGAQDETHHGHHARQLSEAHEVSRPAACARLGDAVPGPLEHHHQGHPFLQRELTEAIALVGGAGAYGTAEHGHIFGSGERWAAVDPPGPSNECVTRDGWILRGSYQLSDLEERSRVEQGRNALTGVEAPALLLASEADVATHGKRLGLPARNFLEGWDPVLRFITQRESASPAECRHISLPTLSLTFGSVSPTWPARAVPEPPGPGPFWAADRIRARDAHPSTQHPNSRWLG